LASDFKRAAEALVVDEKERVKAGERKQSLVDDFEYIYEKDLLPYFKNVPLRSIDKAKVAEYLAHIGQRNLSSRTKKNHLLHLRKVLAKAEDLKLIDQIPTFPKVTLKQSPREWFNEDQYVKLYRTMQKVIEQNVTVRGVPITEHLKHLVEFMLATFLRASDIKIIQNKHITVVRKPDHAYLRIAALSKVVPAPVISLESAVYLYENHLKGDPEAYLFFPQYGRGTAMGIMAKQFKYVLEKAGLYEIDGSPQTRSITSLRHTAIMRQLLHGELPLAVLARNCRTSIQMIEKFYGHSVQGEMAAKKMFQQDTPPDSLSKFYET
jgi:hypothetical protein